MATAIGIVPTAGNWSPFTATFTGSAADAGESITIRLVSTGVQGNFDDVQLTAVPEPSFMGVVGIGLAGLLAFARRNRLRLGDIDFPDKEAGMSASILSWHCFASLKDVVGFKARHK